MTESPMAHVPGTAHSFCAIGLSPCWAAELQALRQLSQGGPCRELSDGQGRLTYIRRSVERRPLSRTGPGRRHSQDKQSG